MVGEVALADSTLSTGAQTVATALAPSGYDIVAGSVQWTTTTPSVVELLDASDRNASVTVRARGTGPVGLSARFVLRSKNGSASVTIGGPGGSRGAISTGTAALSNVTVQPPSLTYATPPTASVVAGTSLGNVRVELRDAAGRVLTGLTDSVFVAIDAGSGSPGATLLGTRRVLATAGVATLSDLSVRLAGTGYRLVATSPATTASATATFSVMPGAPSAATSTIEVADGTIQAGDSTRVTITLRDAFGNIVTSAGTGAFATSVTGGALGDFACVAGVCSGFLSSTVAGTAQVAATIGGTAISGSPVAVIITAGDAAYFVITGDSTQVAGTAQTITITAYDRLDNVAVGYDGDKDLVFAGATAAPLGTKPTTDVALLGMRLLGVLAATAPGDEFGVTSRLTFSAGVSRATMTLYAAETATITATDGTVVTSETGELPVVVRHNIPSTTQSRISLAQSRLEPGERTTLTLELFDEWGNPIDDIDETTVTLGVTLGNIGPVSCTLNVCTAEYTAVTPGVESLSADLDGAGVSAEPVEVEIEVVQVPVALALGTPAAGANSGAAFTTQPVVRVVDRDGALVSGDTSMVTMTVSTGPTVIGTFAVRAVAGVATFSTVGLAGPVGNYTLTFSSGTLTAVTQPIALGAGVAARLKITGSATQVAGVAQTISITAFDAEGNVATGYAGAKALTFSGATNAPAGDVPSVDATAFGTATSVAFVAGVASTPSMVLFKAETATVGATDGTITATGTDRLTVVVSANEPDAAQSSIVIAPSTVPVSGTATVTITLRDAYGNPVLDADATSFLGAVSLGGGTLGAFTCVNGVCTATYTAPSTAGTPTVSATIGGSPIGGSPLTVTVTPADAARLVITGAATQVAGAAQTLTITAYDSAGNIAIGYTGTKSLTFSGADSAAAGNTPTVDGEAFGSATSVSFVDGVASAPSLVLYAAGTDTIATTDGTISAAGADRLVVTVSASAADAGQSTMVVSNDSSVVNGTLTVTVTVRDAYGNVVVNATPATLTGGATSGAVAGFTCVSGVCTATYTAPTTVGADSIDVTVGGASVGGSPAPVAVIAGPAAELRITGAATQVAGTTQTITITAYDAFGNVATDYAGGKSLVFSGASLAPNGTAPTVAAIVVGDTAAVTFADGVATAAMTLYAAETANIDATDGTISATGHELAVTVTASTFINATLVGPSSVQLSVEVAFTLTALDTYGNAASPTATTDFSLSSDLAGSFAVNPVSIAAGGTSVEVRFTPSAAGSHTLTASQVAGAATATAPLTVIASDPVSDRIVCTQSQSGGSSSAQSFTATLCETGVPATSRDADDLQIVTITLQPSNGSDISGVTFTAPTGWTLLGTQAQGPVQAWVFYKRHVPGDPASVTFTSSSKNKWVVDMITYRGETAAVPVLASAASSTTSISAPSVTTTSNDAIVYYNLSSNESTVAYSVPTDLVARTTNQVGGAANSMFGYDRLVATPAAVAPVTFVSASAVNSVLMVIVFDP